VAWRHRDALVADHEPTLLTFLLMVSTLIRVSSSPSGAGLATMAPLDCRIIRLGCPSTGGVSTGRFGGVSKPDPVRPCLPPGIDLPVGVAVQRRAPHTEKMPMEPDREQPPAEAARLWAETEKLEAEAVKLMAEARRFDNNTILDVSKLLLALFAAVLAGLKTAESLGWL